MLVGAGAVGESILKVMQWRDQKGEWLKYVLVCDYDLKRAEEVVGMMKGDSRFEASKIDATNTEKMAELIREHKIDFVMDAAPPFASNMIFDAAFKTGADYGSMGTWSVPMENPAYGLGIENSYTEPMTKYNFDRHEAWKKQGNMAVICMGIDPGVVNVFAKYAATELLDEITEVHVKDGGNLSVPGADPDDIMFGFNVWTVLDEVMNPNVEYDKEKGGFIVEKAFAGQEVYEMPEGVGKNTLVKVEHEEVVTMARYLSQYGLKKATFKISLDENLITSLKNQGATINSWGVGTNLITSKDCPSFGGVYKLAAIMDKKTGKFIPKIKLSENEEKITNPGNKTTYRIYGKDSHKVIADIICLVGETFNEDEPLLLFDPIATWKKTLLAPGTYTMRELPVQVFKDGECIYHSPKVMDIQKYCKEELNTLWDETKRLVNPHEVHVDLSKPLWDMKHELLDKYHFE